MQRNPQIRRAAKKQPLLPPKKVARPALKPMSRPLPKQHRGGR